MTARERFRHVLSGTPLLASLPSAAGDALVDAARHRRYDAGQVIYLAGDPADQVFVLERGWVKSTRTTRAGREQGLRLLRPGELFGHIGLFADGTYPGTTTALEPADVWAIPGATVVALVRQHPDLGLALLREMGRRIVHFIDLVEDLGLHSVEARVAHNLLQHAVSVDGRLVVPRRGWATLDEMAVRLGTVRDVLSRTLRKLESEGLVGLEREAVVVLDPAALAERSRR